MKTKRTYKDDLDNSAGSGKCTFSRVDLNKSINIYLQTFIIYTEK